MPRPEGLVKRLLSRVRVGRPGLSRHRLHPLLPSYGAASLDHGPRRQSQVLQPLPGRHGEHLQRRYSRCDDERLREELEDPSAILRGLRQVGRVLRRLPRRRRAARTNRPPGGSHPAASQAPAVRRRAASTQYHWPPWDRKKATAVIGAATTGSRRWSNLPPPGHVPVKYLSRRKHRDPSILLLQQPDGEREGEP